MGQYGGIQRPSRRDDQMPMGGFGIESFDSPSTPLQTFQPGTITADQMRFTGQLRNSMARFPGTPEPPEMFTDKLTGKQVTQAEVDSLGGMQTFLDPNAERARAKRVAAANLRHEQTIRGGNTGNLIGVSGPSGGQFGSPSIQPPQQRGGMFNQPQQRGGMFNQPQQRGGMFNQQNQFGGQQGQQGMQQMMQFMQQMMQMFSMMGGQNRSPYGGGGYQQPQMQRMMPQQQYQRPQMQYQMPQMQYQPPQMQQQMQRQPQQPSPFAQSIRPRY